eukprot:2185748-Heterocapsa_arctica.AAC.1
MAALRGLVPTDGVLAEWANVGAALACSALAVPALKAIFKIIGDVKLDNLALFAALGVDVLREALLRARAPLRRRQQKTKRRALRANCLRSRRPASLSWSLRRAKDSGCCSRTSPRPSQRSYSRRSRLLSARRRECHLHMA